MFLKFSFFLRNPNSPELSFKWENTNVENPKYLSIDGDNTKMVHELLYSSRVKLWEDIEYSWNGIKSN